MNRKGPTREAAVRGRAKALITRRLQRQAHPIALTGFTGGHFKMLVGKDLDALLLDESYQRVKISEWVGILAAALRQGGSIPDPITVAERPDGRWFVVDGQQRVWAALDTGSQLPAVIYKVRDVNDERRAFSVLNAQRRITPDYLVRAWVGPIGQLIRDAEAGTLLNGGLAGKINLSNISSRPLSASALVIALGPVLGSGSGVSRDITTRMMYLDTLLGKPGARQRAIVFLELVVSVFGGMTAGSRVRSHWLRGLAQAAVNRWKVTCQLPDEATLARLRRFGWATAIPSAESKYMPVLIAEIERRWKETDK